MDEGPEPRRAVPEGRGAVPVDDPREVRVPGRELGDRGVEAGTVEWRDQTTEPPAANPPAGIGSNGRPSAPRSHARAFSPSDGPVIAALLEDDEPAAERGDPPADLVIDVRGEREVADRVEAVRVEAERDHDDGAGHGADRLDRPVRRREVVLVGRPGAERQVQVLAGPCPLPGLVGAAEEVRVRPLRVGVDRHVAHVATAPEDLLGAVAVVVVDVEDRDPLAASPR